MRLIKLSGKHGVGKFITVDDEDFENLSRYTWYALLRSDGLCVYAARAATVGGKKTAILMHRQITHAPKGMCVDHIDGNTLNNTRGNLRICTEKENNRNRKPESGTSQYKGVYLYYGKWTATIRVHPKTFYLGRYENEVNAAKAYDAAARFFFGEYAKTNFDGDECLSPEQIRFR